MGSQDRSSVEHLEEATEARGPLTGLRIVELGHFIAGPFGARLLADLGAEVIKIEPRDEGDPARGWGLAVDGQSLWWPVHARNKKSVTLDLKSPEGRQIALELIAQSDAVIENFRPNQLERWGLGPDNIRHINPRCILVRISGFGQYGPYRDKAAFGVIGEAMGGIRHLSAYPPGTTDLPPVRTGVSLSDSVAGIYGAMGLLAALYERDVKGSGKGRTVDVALFEAIFSLLEGCLPEFGKLGVVRAPTGSTLPTNAPSNAYQCLDGKWICIAGNSDRIFVRLMRLMGKPETASDPKFETNWKRVDHAAELDAMIAAWTVTMSAASILALLDDNQIPASLIYTIADCAQDEQFLARRMIQEVHDAFHGPLLHPGIVPQFDGKPGTIRWSGPQLGVHTDEVLTDILGFKADRIQEMRAKNVI